MLYYPGKTKQNRTETNIFTRYYPVSAEFTKYSTDLETDLDILNFAWTPDMYNKYRTHVLKRSHVAVGTTIRLFQCS